MIAYESLIHCSVCKGDVWYLFDGWPRCLKCYPLEDVEIIELKNKAWLKGIFYRPRAK